MLYPKSARLTLALINQQVLHESGLMIRVGLSIWRSQGVSCLRDDVALAARSSVNLKRTYCLHFCRDLPVGEESALMMRFVCRMKQRVALKADIPRRQDISSMSENAIARTGCYSRILTVERLLNWMLSSQARTDPLCNTLDRRCKQMTTVRMVKRRRTIVSNSVVYF